MPAISSLKVPELRKILLAKGIPCHGKKREELLQLVDRAQGRYEDIEPCDHLESESKRRRVEVDGTVYDVNKCSVSWDSDLRGIPSVTLGDVFAFLIDCGWTSQRMKEHKSDDGFMLFKEHHVENVEVGRICGHSSLLYVRGKVKPEQRQTGERYLAWLLCSTSGEVKTAGCGCVAADDGSCKHVVAILFAIEDFCQRHTDRHTVSATDLQCKWDQPRRESTPAKVVDLDYRHRKDAPKKPAPIPSQYCPLQSFKSADVAGLRQHLQGVCSSAQPGALFLTLVGAPAPSHQVKSMHTLAAEYRSSGANDVTEFLVKNTSKADIKHLCELSQEDPEWLSSRVGRITASLAGSIYSLRDISKAESLISRVLGNNANIEHPNLEYGRRFEPIARQLYISKMEVKHKGFNNVTTGLHILPSAPYLGASPDGITSCKCHGTRLLEIKCTRKHQAVLPEEIPDLDPMYHLTKKDDTISLKETSPWYFQVQFQMGVTSVSLCDLVIHTRRGISVMEVPFDENVWNKLKEKAKSIFLEKVFPKL